MSQTTRDIIKSYFETGDRPTQQQFEDWLDSVAWYDEILSTSNGRIGQTTLVLGTKSISIPGITNTSKAFVTLVSASGATLTGNYQAVCTTDTLTIRANLAAGTVNIADTSTLNYLVLD